MSLEQKPFDHMSWLSGNTKDDIRRQANYSWFVQEAEEAQLAGRLLPSFAQELQLIEPPTAFQKDIPYYINCNLPDSAKRHMVMSMSSDGFWGRATDLSQNGKVLQSFLNVMSENEKGLAFNPIFNFHLKMDEKTDKAAFGDIYFGILADPTMIRARYTDVGLTSLIVMDPYSTDELQRDTENITTYGSFSYKPLHSMMSRFRKGTNANGLPFKDKNRGYVYLEKIGGEWRGAQYEGSNPFILPRPFILPENFQAFEADDSEEDLVIEFGERDNSAVMLMRSTKLRSDLWIDIPAKINLKSMAGTLNQEKPQLEEIRKPFQYLHSIDILLEQLNTEYRLFAI